MKKGIRCERLGMSPSEWKTGLALVRRSPFVNTAGDAF